jgi:hypothetical protein
MSNITELSDLMVLAYTHQKNGELSKAIHLILKDWKNKQLNT